MWIIRQSSSATIWGGYPIVHGAYYSTYFEDTTIHNFDTWAATSTNLQGFDIFSNGDLALGYKANIE